jgi:hypothetical protein
MTFYIFHVIDRKMLLWKAVYAGYEKKEFHISTVFGERYI